jgi:hypothetical protein
MVEAALQPHSASAAVPASPVLAIDGLVKD